MTKENTTGREPNNSFVNIIDPADTRDSRVCIITTGTFKGRHESEQEFITRSAGIIRAIVTPVGTYFNLPN